ncbi:hypothetical protein PDO_1133 [Rhizobium sp. PDO1-076]|uniref:hypothetical protein n=1 Tax=Rhizobium sp. PDO1-076 TaxID=1125979 RepID=UPI00024E372A|nr:hypothetical protein [Rhizobium sp. PDO1-076]EHS53423.1 hypothetical protein PDO_1133 [Rhizobium sp. PDO1-076]
MTDHIPVTSALLRSLPRMDRRADRRLEARFESGAQSTKPVTKAYERQQAGLAATDALKETSRVRRTPEKRRKATELRRRWGGSGSLPHEIRHCYSEAERAALAVIAERCKRRGYCDATVEEIADVAGVSRTSVQNAVRKAKGRALGHIKVTVRPRPGQKHLTSVIRIICAKWLTWLGRAIGLKRLSTSESGVNKTLSEMLETAKRALEGERADPLSILMQPLRVLTGRTKSEMGPAALPIRPGRRR